MNANELIAALQSLTEDQRSLPVVVYSDEWSQYWAVTGIKQVDVWTKSESVVSGQQVILIDA